MRSAGRKIFTLPRHHVLFLPALHYLIVCIHVPTESRSSLNGRCILWWPQTTACSKPLGQCEDSRALQNYDSQLPWAPRVHFMLHSQHATQPSIAHPLSCPPCPYSKAMYCDTTRLHRTSHHITSHCITSHHITSQGRPPGDMAKVECFIQYVAQQQAVQQQHEAALQLRQAALLLKAGPLR